MKIMMMAVLLFTSFTQQVFAFDGKREGFVIGFGLGAGFVMPAGDGDNKKNISSPFMSGTLAYGFNDNFQIGIGKKVVSFKYNNKTVYQELGGFIVDVFLDDYYVSIGGGVSGAVNKVSLDDYLLGNASFVALGYEFTQGFNAEFVVGSAKFDTSNSTVVTPQKETFLGVLLTTYFY